jgi:hypothetical protein
VVWVSATAVFALAQAATGSVLVLLFAQTGSYALLFAAGLAASVAALLVSTPTDRR